jgi:hypothetical protein
MKMSQFVDRISRAVQLEPDLYQEVKADPASLPAAMAVVLLSSLAGGIGSLHLGLHGFIVGSIASFAGWFLWSLTIYIVGARILPEAQTRTSFAELFRLTGFASAPGILRLFAAIPYLGGVVVFAASLWTLMTMLAASRQALEYKSGWRVAGVCLLGWVAQGMAIAPFLLRMSAPAGQ